MCYCKIYLLNQCPIDQKFTACWRHPVNFNYLSIPNLEQHHSIYFTDANQKESPSWRCEIVRLKTPFKTHETIPCSAAHIYSPKGFLEGIAYDASIVRGLYFICMTKKIKIFRNNFFRMTFCSLFLSQVGKVCFVNQFSLIKGIEISRELYVQNRVSFFRKLINIHDYWLKIL